MKRQLIVLSLVVVMLLFILNVSLSFVGFPESAVQTRSARPFAVLKLSREIGRIRQLTVDQKRQIEESFLERTRLKAELKHLRNQQGLILKELRRRK